MAINFSLRNFYDDCSEIIGIKSGLLLNRSRMSSILIEKGYQETFLKKDNLNTYVRIHSSDMEDMIVTLRKKIGNLPEILPSQKEYQTLQEYFLKTKDFTGLASYMSRGFHIFRENPNISEEELTNFYCNLYKVNSAVGRAMSITTLEKLDQSLIFPERKDWNGAVDLSSLFDCEVKSEGDFLEQKFIDYLASNGHEIELIHWRNFERFCAEYFKRQGYCVILGPGSNDGGIDIKVYNEIDNNKPEIIIQCKRYTGERKVDIETVKAFYTDVTFEGAKSGIIATTGYIAPGGKKVCEVRGYNNIKFSEKENVKKWAKDIATFKS